VRTAFEFVAVVFTSSRRTVRDDSCTQCRANETVPTMAFPSCRQVAAKGASPFRDSFNCAVAGPGVDRTVVVVCVSAHPEDATISATPTANGR
jgi:hypothetical protein